MTLPSAKTAHTAQEAGASGVGRVFPYPNPEYAHLYGLLHLKIYTNSAINTTDQWAATSIVIASIE